jgi:hypothetical protein
MGIDMMKASTKLSMTAVAGLLGVALATGAAYAATATGALSAADAPGQVLKVSGVAPAAALAHANTNAKGLFGTTPAAAKAKGLARATAMSGAANHSSVGQVSRAAAQSTVGQVSRPAAQTLPAYHAVVPSTMTAHPAAPRPMMTPGTSTAPHTMR